MKYLIYTILLLVSIKGLSQESDSVAWDSVAWDSIEQDTTIYHEEETFFDGFADTTQITNRNFLQSDLENLKADPDLSYEQPPTIAESLWDRFKRWLAWLFEDLIFKTITTDFTRILMYVGALILVIVIIMTLLKVNAFKVFYSGADQGKQGYQVFHENIHEMDFEKLISEAVEKNQFRIATRLVFLHSLKLLSDKHLIDFNPGKTNHDYVEELKSSELKTGLNELSFYFDYAWYGNFQITSEQFQTIQNTFRNWQAKIN